MIVVYLCLLQSWLYYFLSSDNSSDPYLDLFLGPSFGKASLLDAHKIGGYYFCFEDFDPLEVKTKKQRKAGK